MKSLLVVLATLHVIVAAVQAQDCKSPQTQADMNQCATVELVAAAKELDKIYNEYQARLSKEQRQQIQDVQLAWIQFRDLTCKFETSGAEAGSAYGIAFSICVTRMTRERAKHLRDLANCKEGDLNCPVWK